MATAILRRNPNSNPRRLSDPDHGRPRRRKLSPVSVASRPPAAAPPSSKNLEMGQVKILKRGEPLTASFAAAPRGCGGGGGGSPGLFPRDALAAAAAAKGGRNKRGDPDLGLGSIDRLGPDPEVVQRQIRVGELPGVYAGPGMCVSSPPPSSVPVPCFLGKNDLATCGLRRLLGLHLS